MLVLKVLLYNVCTLSSSVYVTVTLKVAYGNETIIFSTTIKESRRLFCVAIILWSSHFSVLHEYFVVKIFASICYRMHKKLYMLNI